METTHDLAHAIERIKNLTDANKSKQLLVVVAGGTCSGKSYFSDKLNLELLQSEVIRLDNYFRDIDDPDLPRNEINHKLFDHPDSYHLEEFVDDIRRLMSNRSVSCPVYNIVTNLRTEKTLTLLPKAVIIADGLFTIRFLKSKFPNCFCVYTDASQETILQRRIKRDTVRYQIDEATVRFNFYDKVWPYTQKYIATQEPDADLVLISD